MNENQIEELLNRLRVAKARYSYNSEEGEDGTFWIGNIERIEPIDLILIRTYEFDIKRYLKNKMRDLM